MVEPFLQTAGIADRTRVFWLIFTVLDVCAAALLILFFRKFGEDTPATRRGAARAMRILYGLIALLGAGFLVLGLSASPVQYRTVVQALIFLALGAGGIAINRRAMASSRRAS
jgi:hypothetical protein